MPKPRNQGRMRHDSSNNSPTKASEAPFTKPPETSKDDQSHQRTSAPIGLPFQEGVNASDFLDFFEAGSHCEHNLAVMSLGKGAQSNQPADYSRDSKRIAPTGQRYEGSCLRRSPSHCPTRVEASTALASPYYEPRASLRATNSQAATTSSAC